VSISSIKQGGKIRPAPSQGADKKFMVEEVPILKDVTVFSDGKKSPHQLPDRFLVQAEQWI